MDVEICNKAVMNQIGNWGTGYFTVSMLIHTFNSLVLKRRQSVIISATTITVGWITAALLGTTVF